MYGERLVIPTRLQPKVLQLLHKGHPGIERMRSVARNYVYWPGIDDQIAQRVKACVECSKAAKFNIKTNLQSWSAPERPWQRIHADFAGPVDGNFFLIVVDSYSKWPEVIPTKRISTAATLNMFREIFARHGMPETLVTDNGTQFTSECFERYCESNGILHLRTPPYHPQSNGLAERFVDTFKRGMKKITTGGEALREAIDTFLLCYRSTPCRSAPSGKSSAELLVGRKLRTALDLLKPSAPPTQSNHSAQEAQFNRKHGTKSINYDAGDLVWAKQHRNNAWTWEAGRVIERVGHVLYNVWLTDGQNLVRSHCNQLRKRNSPDQPDQQQSSDSVRLPLDILLGSCGMNRAETESTTPAPEKGSFPGIIQPTGIGSLSAVQPPGVRRRRSTIPQNATTQPEQVQPRLSSRVRRAPVRYAPYQFY
ncbi:uncharacterized protein K02A2.6-like [Uranotaenia lowii]|uniref:uncharacterized protein K02A2.6-like n=1 Tax=Uranotaenia lowii TaxID=190385 RepID=UPI00247956B1|nr:uncharacterized protein K02A2.6-like [Uranotaenia lowii]XP_055606666.1 uncharacterized protein K02A2.6-like [Uranotaenia lowii]XP_055606667.1 uncharacterized protein K02A2.6-like [Uranotaenia lowii]XP_055606668.1 uncharacterized protein K02A2.6-like [Uranotaenia lowii]